MIPINILLKLRFPNARFPIDITLGDSGNGIEIKEWNLEDPIPTENDLKQWSIDYDLQYRQQQALNQRIYPPLGAQLDMMYHDHQNNTTVWIDTIEAIKLANPKPTE